MKKLTLIITFFVSISVFPSTTFAKWVNLGEDVNGVTYYIEDERIRERDGYIFFWDLRNYPKPDEYGTFSAQKYRKVDCNAFRFKYLTHHIYKHYLFDILHKLYHLGF